MLKLRIKEKGHVVTIPGIGTFRTPVDIQLNLKSIQMAETALQQHGITQYELISDVDGEKKSITRKIESKDDGRKELSRKLDNIEDILYTLLLKSKEDMSIDKEQIIERLGQIERLIVDRPTTIITKEGEKEKLKEKDEDMFIPEIDISKSQIKGSSKEKVKQEYVDLDDSADLLSSLMKK